MADEELRALERRWRTTGALDDGAAFLNAKLRAGLVDEPRLRLAAFVGDPAATLVAGCDPAPRHLLTCDRSGLQSYFERLDEWGREAATRVAVASARSLQRLGLGVGLDRDAVELVGEGIAAAEAWLCTPSDETKLRASATASRLISIRRSEGRDRPRAAVTCAIEAARATLCWPERNATGSACGAVYFAALVLDASARDRRPLLNGIWWEISWWALGLSA